MPTSNITRFIFVDFENVPTVDLTLVAGQPVHVTLLIGKRQTKLDVSLVQQMRRIPEQVDLIEVGSSGRNALDLTLAYYLGRAAERRPDAHFTIVSRDKDFEAMLAHLAGQGIKADRRDSFAAAFQAIPGKKSPVTAKAQPPAKKPPIDRLEKLIARLKNNLAPRPKNRARLLAHINTAYGGKLTDAEQTGIVEALIKRGVLEVEAKDRVRYL